MITSLLSLQREYVADAAAREQFTASEQRIRLIAFAYEALHRAGGKDLDAPSYLRDLVDHLLRTREGGTGRIAVRSEVAPISFGIDIAIPCGLILIVRELLSNAVKHAFVGRERGEIWISLQPGGRAASRLPFVTMASGCRSRST